MTRLVAVTGGTGFLGGAVIDQLLERGDRVRALARDPAKLGARDAEVVAGDLNDEAALLRLADGADGFIHCAGLVRARRDDEFHAINVEGAERAARAAAAAGAKFVHVSSMSARKPAASPYAASKHRSEEAVRRGAGGGRWIALRAPAIYGPRDRATLPYFRLVKAGLAAEPRTVPEARASILLVDDAARAVIFALDAAPAGAVYEIGDDRPEGYSWAEIGATLGDVLGVRTRRVRLPRSVVAGFHGVHRSVDLALGRTPELRSGQVNELFHPDWVARDNLLSAATDWRPAAPLKEGFAKAVRWYQENGLL